MSQGRAPGASPKGQCCPGWLPGGTWVTQGTTDGVPVIHRLPRKPVPSSVQSVPAAGTSLALPPESDVFLGLVTGEWGGGTWVHRRPPWLCTPRVSSTSLPCPSLPPSLLLSHPFRETSDCVLIISLSGASYQHIKSTELPLRCCRGEAGMRKLSLQTGGAARTHSPGGRHCCGSHVLAHC